MLNTIDTFLSLYKREFFLFYRYIYFGFKSY